MKKIVIVNAGPRKGKWNTASMLAAAGRGAAARGAEVVTYDLYYLDFKGCYSCFACQRVGAQPRCAANDGLSAVLDDILKADALIVGSPIYFGDVTGEMRSFLERLWFAGLSYAKDRKPRYARRIPVGLVFTMNVPDAEFYTNLFRAISGTMERFFGPTQVVTAVETQQFEDYSKYAADAIDPERRYERHRTVFPEELKTAEEMGANLAAWSE